MKDEMSGAGLIFNSRTLSLRLQFTIIIIKKSSRASNSTAPNTVQVKAEQSTPASGCVPVSSTLHKCLATFALHFTSMNFQYSHAD